ncbi:hypothetical protein [Acidimangrovimonas pyrenivorans]|uniref:Uncharacterized protein n=1 Tax=Acidimangrovimonas pyrenivorans TaxID=2030798 RepID=A0ABV7AHX2_9RHOB
MLETLPFSYPDDDDVRYLEWFGKDFASVFVALNSFLRLPGFPPYRNGDWVPAEVVEAAKKRGPDCGVSWAEIAGLCGFPSARHVNRALRLTGSKRIDPEYANREDTEKLLRICAENGIYPPDEGRPSPLFELSLGQFLTALGQEEVILADHFGVLPVSRATAEFLDRDRIVGFGELYAKDRSLYVANYIDYDHYLVCQTGESLARARPDAYFEGFYAGETTDDCWGIGILDGD